MVLRKVSWKIGLSIGLYVNYGSIKQIVEFQDEKLNTRSHALRNKFNSAILCSYSSLIPLLSIGLDQSNCKYCELYCKCC